MHRYFSFIITLILFISNTIYSQNKIIEGYIIETATKKRIMFASVGILKKNIGTIANSVGYYSLSIDEYLNINDSIRFSSIGYKTKTFLIRDILSANNFNIELESIIKDLPEVVVLSQNYKLKTFGNYYKGEKIIAGFQNNVKGAECGILVNIKGKAFLDKLMCNIAKCTYDSVFFRINVYQKTSEGKFNNILLEPIYFSQIMRDNTKSFSIDLSQYNIEVVNKTLITIEYVKDMGEGELMFSCGLVRGAESYYRKTAEGEWKRSRAKFGFNITAFVDNK